MAQILAWKRTQITFLKINLESQSLTGSSYFVGNGRLLLFKQLCFFFVDMQIKTLSEFHLIRPRCILIDKSLSNIIIRYSATPYYLPLVSNLQLTLYITAHSHHRMFPALFSEVSLGSTRKPLLLLKLLLLKRGESLWQSPLPSLCD